MRYMPKCISNSILVKCRNNTPFWIIDIWSAKWHLQSSIACWMLIETCPCNVQPTSDGMAFYVDLATHYSEVVMDALASQITVLTIVYSTVYSDADRRKHQSSASLACVWGIHRWPMNTPHKWPVTRKMFPFDDVITWVAEFGFHIKWRWRCVRLTLEMPRYFSSYR